MSRKILVLAPHPDDGELGCGGTIAKLAREGNTIYYAAVTSCNETLPEKYPRGTLVEECKRATRILGIDENNLWFLGYEVRNLQEFRQKILDDFVKIYKTFTPDIVFMPSPADTHQDHKVTTQEGFRAFKNCNIFGYDLPWNCIDFRATCFSTLTEKEVYLKQMAISEYRSQAHRNYMNDFARPNARVRGAQSNQQYAEAFEVIRIKI